MTNYWIRSTAFPNAHLRMDGSTVTAFNGAGSGTVNCQFYAAGTEPQVGGYEDFQLVPLGKRHAFGIQSQNFPSAYLRMDGSKVTAFNGAGSGTVNCQFYATGKKPKVAAGDGEDFELVPIAGSTAFAIRSVTWPNVYLRMDGSTVTAPNGAGSGTVNCQFYATGTEPTVGSGNLESFYVSGV